MLETVLKIIGYTTNAYTFVVTNIKTLLIVSASVAILYFVIGFFNLRNELAETKRVLAAVRAHAEQLEKDVRDISSARDELTQKARELEAQRRELTDKLMRHNLSKMSERHSKLVEKAVNGGTEKALRCFESITRGGGC
jgi:predicted nuclease with TOPRIM domain